MRTELLKLQITSPGVRAQSAGVSSRVRRDCDDDGIVCLDLDHNDRVSGPWSVLTPHTPYTGPHCSTGHPLYLSTSDICILTFCSVQLLQSVYDRPQIYSRAPGPAGQWSVCSIWSAVANNVRVLSSLHH